MSRRALVLILSVALTMATLSAAPADAQDPTLRYGRGVPPVVRSINDRGLRFLVASQQKDGSWSGGKAGAGVNGICLMALLASGQDPDFGRYAGPVRRAVRRIILDQNARTGHITGRGHGSMYHHGFAMLALSEAYGAVSETLLWKGSGVPAKNRRTIGQALELAVRCALTSQRKNQWGAWRYSPYSTDADTTVSGTVLVGLLGARNAGIEIPDQAIEKALGFFKINTPGSGSVSYRPGQSHGDGTCRSSIATVVFAMARRKHTASFKRAAGYVKRRMDMSINGHPHYTRYYMAQALFHSDLTAWRAWNRRTAEKLRKQQDKDGSIASSHGRAYGTGMAVLALALNYRLLPVYER